MVQKDNDDSDDFEVEASDDFTDTDLFDPESIAAELESLQEEAPKKRTASSARAAIEEMIERKRLRSAIKEFDDDDFDMSAL
ncbi:MAG: hypothetical protein AAF184_03485 [Pseudomonadota bacterium]